LLPPGVTGTLTDTPASMGLQRRRANQLAQAEAAALQQLADDHKHAAAGTSDSQQARAAALQQRLQAEQRQRAQQRFPWRSYLGTVLLSLGFWALVRYLHRYAAHMAPHPAAR
jgi:hypothetical protein